MGRPGKPPFHAPWNPTFRPLLIAGLLLFGSPQSASSLPNTYATQRVVAVEAAVQESPPKITLRWDIGNTAATFSISRKPKEEPSWPAPLVTLDGTIRTWEDTGVEIGTAYEYRISVDPGQEGYVFAGIRIPAVHDRGIVHLVVDQTQAAPLETELDQLVQDLIGDGWEVVRDDVSPTDSVESVKSLVVSHYNINPSRMKAVFLFGRVPIPYSGNFAPDGHADHVGAWPADCFYADMDGVWTDSLVNNTGATRPENRNIPGDGKFDQSVIPTEPELMVGRVDLSRMTVFPLSETELLRRYLDKNHRYRQGATPAPARALVSDNFLTRTEGFAQSGWRLASTVGVDNTSAGSWSTLSTTPYLWAYGCGAGSYDRASGVATTGDYVNNGYKAVFQMLFGSYHGDWDNPNNLLRAPLCVPDYGLASCWAGRPNWHFHRMGLGGLIGESALISLKFSPYIMGIRVRGTHVALMGDPTLRMHPAPPPTDPQSIREPGLVNLVWTPPLSPVEGYHVYRAPSPMGPFTRLTSTPLTVPSFVDLYPETEEDVYMIRSLFLQPSASGSYLNLSQGVFAEETDGTGGDPTATPTPDSGTDPTPTPTAVELPASVGNWDLYG